MAEEEVTAPENESETADQEVDSSASKLLSIRQLKLIKVVSVERRREEMTVQNVRQDLHLDGYLCRHGHPTDGVFRSYPILLRYGGAKI